MKNTETAKLSVGILNELKSIRRDAKVSQYDLADRVGINCAHLGRIERGMFSPSLDIVCRIADELGFELTILPKIE